MSDDTNDYSVYPEETICGICGCEEHEHGSEGGICSGCGEECEFDPEEVDDEEDE